MIGRIESPRGALAVLTALNLLNYIDRYVLSAVLPRVQDELHLSNFVAGGLATVFLVGYFATSPLFGQLADRAASRPAESRVGRRGLMAIGVAVWSAATFATGLARGAASLVLSRAVVGVGEASYATIAPTIIDDIAPPEKKGRWLSIFFTAIPVGSALGFVLGGLLGKLGWRTPFYVVGGPGIVAALACLLLVEPARAAAREPPRGDVRATLRRLVAIPLYRRGVLGYCAQTFAVGGFGYWAPAFLYRRYALPLATGSSTFGAILVVAGGLGTALGGLVADRLVARAGAANDDDAASRVGLAFCAWTSVLAAALAAGCFWAPSPGLFFVLAFGCELAVFASTSPINAVLLRTVPVEMRASAMAVSIFAIHLLGDLWSPPLLGLAQDVLPIALAMMGVPIAIAASAALWWTRVERVGSTPKMTVAG